MIIFSILEEFLRACTEKQQHKDCEEGTLDEPHLFHKQLDKEQISLI